jgi:hypothetical protein
MEIEGTRGSPYKLLDNDPDRVLASTATPNRYEICLGGDKIRSFHRFDDACWEFARLVMAKEQGDHIPLEARR